MISGGRNEQLDILPRHGFTSDFLSFIVVEHIQFFHGALQLLFTICSGGKGVWSKVFLRTSKSATLYLGTLLGTSEPSNKGEGSLQCQIRR